MRTFGKARLKDGDWLIQAEAHVAMRLKRAFGKIAQGKTGTLRIRCTDEVCRDLLWFCARWPLDVHPKDVLIARAKRHKQDSEDFGDLVLGKIEPRTFELAIPARDYQRLAADLALRGHGLLLADDMGTGKTASAICMLSDPRTWPALVVTLTALPKQWDREIKRFCPQLRTHVIAKMQPYDVRAGARRARGKQGALIEPEFPHVLIMPYSKLTGWADELAGKVKTLVLDECQEVRRTGDKNKPSQKYEAARLIASKCDFRLGLSGTPIYNYGIEFHNVLSILRPDALGTKQEFVTEWCSEGNGEGKEKILNPRAFGLYLRDAGLMLRRTRADVGRELPPIQRAMHHCDTDTEALREVEGVAALLARRILAADTSFQDRGQSTRELDWRLRQATGIAKAPYVGAFVSMLVEAGEKVLLYGWHRTVYDLWLERLATYKPLLFTGTESGNQKDAAKQRFIEDDNCRVLIMSLRAGAGVDGLQNVCRTVVHGELDWSPGVHEQCDARVFRDGQPHPVLSYYLLAEDGSDPVVSEVLGIKRAQLEGARDPHSDVVSRTSDMSEGIKRLAEHVLAKRSHSAATKIAGEMGLSVARTG